MVEIIGYATKVINSVVNMKMHSMHATNARYFHLSCPYMYVCVLTFIFGHCYQFNYHKAYWCYFLIQLQKLLLLDFNHISLSVQKWLTHVHICIYCAHGIHNTRPLNSKNICRSWTDLLHQKMLKVIKYCNIKCEEVNCLKKNVGQIQFLWFKWKEKRKNFSYLKISGKHKINKKKKDTLRSPLSIKLQWN